MSKGLGVLSQVRDLVRATSERVSRRLGLWALDHFLEESLQAMWRARAMTAFAIGIIGLSLATVGAFALVAQNLGVMVERMSSLEVSVYLTPDAEAATTSELTAYLLEQPGVVHVRHITREDALALFKRINPQLAEVPELLGENPFPASLELTLDPGLRSPALLDALAHDLEARVGVDHVGRDLELAERLAAGSRLFRVIAACLGGVLLLSALFTVSNVVKLTVYARRHEVEVLRLVGATSGYIRGTFVVEGILQGLAGALLALGLLSLAYHGAARYLAHTGLQLLASLTTHFLSPWGILLLLLAGAALGALGSLAPLRRLARI